NYQK
ncbi:putative acyl-CoA synthetase, partial [Vibrio harveyi]